MFVVDSDMRDLALHRLIATRLREEPSLLEQAVRGLEQDLVEQAHPVLIQWQPVLEAGLAATLEVLEDNTSYGRLLRSHSPLRAVLSAKERIRFINQWRSDRQARESNLLVA